MRRLSLVLVLASAMLAAIVVGPATALAVGEPVAVTGAASAVTTTTATVAGTVNPVGQATMYQFDYGTTTAYDHHTTPQSAGSGALDVPVSASLTGLAPATTYHYRVSATNPAGTTPGADQTFTTAGPPTASTGPAVAVASTSAVLTGTVNPGSQATTYAFQYGTTTAYGTQSPAQAAGSGAAGVPVSATVTGLAPATTYHYRLTATNASGTVPGVDQVFVTPGTAGASTLAVTVNPAGGDTDLTTTLKIGTDPGGTPVGAASVVGEALSSQFASQLASFGACPAAKFNNAQGPTAANCPDRTAIVGVGTMVTRGQGATDVTSDQGFLVKTGDNRVVFWWHTPAAGGAAEAFGQVPGVVSQETGLYGPVVTYDFTGLPVGARLKQLTLTYQRNATSGKAPFVATKCVGGSWQFQARIVYLGGVASELPTTTTACGAAGAAPQPSKLQLARATIFRADRVIDVLAPITRRASGNVSLDLFAAGQHHRWTAAVNAADGRIRTREAIPASQANKGTGILTISYPGDADTRPQVVRLRAANVPSTLDASRPTLVGGHLRAQGTVNSLARGVVRVQLEYYSAGKTTTLEKFATIANGAWSLDSVLTTAQQAAITARQGTVHSYILFTGYLPRQLRGEMVSYQVLGAP
jgi:hypothetical protein